MRRTAPRLASLYRQQAAAVIDEFAPDVAHVSRLGREWFYEAIVRELEFRSIPFVLTPNHHPHWNRRRDWWWWDLYKRASGVLVLSDSEGDALVEGGVAPERITRTVIGTVGANAPVVAPAPGSEHPVVLFLGQIRAYKGVDLLYEAMRDVWRTDPDVRLQIIGPWHDRPRLKAQLERDARVDVAGAVSDDEKWERLAHATLLCVPSRAEALGGVYLEAWSVGLPVVGRDIPPVQELFDRTGGGIAVGPGPQAVSGAIRSLLRDPVRRSEMGARGRRAVRTEYNWHEAAERAIRAYMNAIGSARPPAEDRPDRFP